MKVYIGRPKSWFGPYQLAEVLCFWVKKEKDDLGFSRTSNRVHNFGHWLATGSWDSDSDKSNLFGKNTEHETWLYKFLIWINKIIPEFKKIQIDPWDTWSMDHTLAPIILPMLKQLKLTKHGSAIVDTEDVPPHLQHTSYESYESQVCFDFYHDKLNDDFIGTHTRWNWVLDEMIYAFEHIVDDSWEKKFSTGEFDTYSDACSWDENGNPTLYTMKDGPNHTYQCDYAGLQNEWNRIDNGVRLFGKYFRGLWD